MSTPTVPCPTCRRPVEWSEASPHRPFCSQRCKMIDLGTWADESYRIPSQEESPSSPGDHE
ncbi:MULTISPECIES: DNA gyrase inhibitor YacG [Eikenella]|uniref:DNA gyrase inhibitor YacG n=1 Tax=Eikenella longinqua TaxID=1795827 RepID=A0A1A9RVW0_9NEIS|nr:MULTISPECIES: DNA gyrase inhibitor YacG [Eikenella]OAM26112.1 DNA gyrase inhibitor [Eikenella longinqua]